MDRNEVLVGKFHILYISSISLIPIIFFVKSKMLFVYNPIREIVTATNDATAINIVEAIVLFLYLIIVVLT
jgi:hypothetical protein